MGKKIYALCIVAHPDDETIWMGGTIFKNKTWDWTIFSLCRADDPDRAPKFKKACEFYKAKNIISDLDDESDEPLSADGIIAQIKQNLKQTEFDFIFTHGENGEYGHIRHVGVHEAVSELAKENYLKCQKLFFFDYIPGKESSFHDQEVLIPIPNPKADKIILLSPKEINEKINIVKNIYKYPEKSFEVQCCNQKEAFKLR